MILFTITISLALVLYLFMGLLFGIGLLFPSRPADRKKLFVSVIIAARNEEENISRCLISVLNQSYPASLYEIIVVNDRSTDRTRAILEGFAAEYDRVVEVHVSNTPTGWAPKKHAIQTGIEKARGELLLFTDADCEVGPEWIDALVSLFEPDTGVVIGYSAVRSDGFFEELQRIDFLAMMSAACGIANLGFPLAADHVLPGPRW